MGKDPSSPKSRQRQRVFDAYRGRGHRNTNLWLVYSVKTDRDWIVNNDRRLVHWLIFLESNPAVKWFDLDPNRDGEAGMVGTDADCVEVHRVDGGKEWHRVVVGAARDLPDMTAAVISTAAPMREVFSDAELKPHVRRAMRWLKAIGYAGVIRNEKHTPVVVALLAVLRSRTTGNVSEIIDDLHGFEQPVVLGILVRLAISGHVRLDLQSCSFSPSTNWHWNDRVEHVVP